MNYKSELVFNQTYQAFILEIRGVFFSMPDTPPVVDMKHLKGKKALRFIVNLAQVQPLTSKGIRSLIMLKDLSEKEGLEYHVQCNNPALYTILKDLSLHGVFSIIRDLKETVTS